MSLEKKKVISASDSAEILKGEEIFSNIVLSNSSVTGRSFHPSEYDRCLELFAKAAGAINILTKLNRGGKKKN